MVSAKLCDALRAGNVPDDKARDAAAELADFERRLAKVEVDLHLIKWIGGLNLAVTLSIVLRLFLF